MNWDVIGTISEIIGAAAVVVSLLYLSIQIRSQTQQAKLAAAHDISVGFREALDHFADDQIAQAYIRGLSGIDNLEDHELFQILLGAQKMMRVWEEAFYLHQEGQLHGKHWAGVHRQYMSFMQIPAFRHTWELRAEFYGEEFREMVDQSQGIDYKLRVQE